MDNESLTHTKWRCQYHIVFIPKYRRKKMWGAVRTDVVEIIKTLCDYKHVKITAGAVMPDHVHLCVELPPKYSVSSFMGYLKHGFPNFNVDRLRLYGAERFSTPGFAPISVAKTSIQPHFEGVSS